MSSEINLPDKKILDRLTLDSNIITSLSQNVIITTEDKIELCLLKFLKKAQQKKKWLVPLGVFLPSITTLITSDFKDIIFEKSVWYALFIIVCVFSFCLLLYSLKDILKSYTLREVINEIKNISEETNLISNIEKKGIKSKISSLFVK